MAARISALSRVAGVDDIRIAAQVAVAVRVRRIEVVSDLVRRRHRVPEDSGVLIREVPVHGAGVAVAATIVGDVREGATVAAGVEGERSAAQDSDPGDAATVVLAAHHVHDRARDRALGIVPALSEIEEIADRADLVPGVAGRRPQAEIRESNRRVDFVFVENRHERDDVGHVVGGIERISEQLVELEVGLDGEASRVGRRRRQRRGGGSRRPVGRERFERRRQLRLAAREGPVRCARRIDPA